MALPSRVSSGVSLQQTHQAAWAIPTDFFFPFFTFLTSTGDDLVEPSCNQVKHVRRSIRIFEQTLYRKAYFNGATSTGGHSNSAEPDAEDAEINPHLDTAPAGVFGDNGRTVLRQRRFRRIPGCNGPVRIAEDCVAG